MNDTLAAVGKSILNCSELMIEIYRDGAKPGIIQVGKSLETVVGFGNTLLYPIALLNGRSRLVLDRNLEKYRQQLTEIPIEQVFPIPPEIGVPIVEKLGYVSDEVLSGLYINLLAKAATSSAPYLCHPGYIKVIESISPDEALFLNQFDYGNSVPFLSTGYENSDGTVARIVQPFYRLHQKSISELKYPDNTDLYIANLAGLGVLDIRKDIFSPKQNLYSEIAEQQKKHDEDAFASCSKDGFTVKKHSWGRLELNHFGFFFHKACTKGLQKPLT